MDEAQLTKLDRQLLLLSRRLMPDAQRRVIHRFVCGGRDRGGVCQASSRPPARLRQAPPARAPEDPATARCRC